MDISFAFAAVASGELGLGYVHRFCGIWKNVLLASRILRDYSASAWLSLAILAWILKLHYLMMFLRTRSDHYVLSSWSVTACRVAVYVYPMHLLQACSTCINVIGFCQSCRWFIFTIQCREYIYVVNNYGVSVWSERTHVFCFQSTEYTVYLCWAVCWQTNKRFSLNTVS